MRRPRLDDLLRVAAKETGCSIKELQSKKRRKDIVEARMVFTALSKHFGYRHYEIGWSLHKWRTSANYYAKRVVEMQADPYFEARVNNIIKSVSI